MKRLVLIAAALLAAVVMYAQGSFENYPLPQNPDTLRILAVGNSFSAAAYFAKRYHPKPVRLVRQILKYWYL